MRLAICWAHVREFLFKKDPEYEHHDLPTKDELIKKFDQKCGPASELLTGLQQAVNDFTLGLQEGIKNGDPDAVSLLSRYKKETGRNFFHDAGNPRKVVIKILKRGTIANETEFYLLKELLSDGDQTVFSAIQTTRAIEMIDCFEFGDVT